MNYRNKQSYKIKDGIKIDEKGYYCYFYKEPSLYYCNKCDYWKKKDAFYKNKHRSTGVKSICKVCDKIDSKERYNKRA